MSKFKEVLADLLDIRSELIDAEADAYARMERAKRRLDSAELDSDMRTWSPDERDEYHAALAEYKQAYDEWTAAKAAL